MGPLQEIIVNNLVEHALYSKHTLVALRLGIVGGLTEDCFLSEASFYSLEVGGEAALVRRLQDSENCSLLVLEDTKFEHEGAHLFARAGAH